jgi:hypothetical protein
VQTLGIAPGVEILRSQPKGEGIYMNTNLFTSIIDPELAAVAACPALQDAIVMTVISNTAAQQRIPADGLKRLLEMAKDFGKSNFILIQRGTNYKEFKFDEEDGIKNMKLLTGLLNELKDASVVDVNNISYEDKPFNGFCWKEEYSNGNRFCGCYFLAVRCEDK